MNVKDAFYHGMREQITRVLTALGEDRVSMGLTAFETGSSSWGSCFFARAYPEYSLGRGQDPEYQVADLLGMPGNRVPMRIVYKTFDGLSTYMTKPEMQKFIASFLDEQRPAEVNAAIDELLAKVDYTGVEDKPVDFTEVCVR